MSARGLGRAAERLMPLVIVLGAVAFAFTLYANVRAGLAGFDFYGNVWNAGRAILEGQSPYPDPRSAQIRSGHPTVYPPAITLAALPLATASFVVALVVWNVLSAAAMWFALRIVGLRDWRCYALVMVSFPLAANLAMGQTSAFLALGCALAWRYRDRTGGALAVAAAVAAKLFLWPLFVWLVATRRVSKGVLAASSAAILLLGSWAVIGFGGLRDYPRLMRAVADHYEGSGHSLVAAGMRLGLSDSHARPISWVAGLVLLSLVVLFARGAHGDRRAFAAAVGAGILASPIVWTHYFLLLTVPLAAARPRLGAPWYALFLFWLSTTEPPEESWRLFTAIGGALVLLLGSLLPRRARAVRTAPELAAAVGPARDPAAMTR